jgi:hypothetical protein
MTNHCFLALGHGHGSACVLADQFSNCRRNLCNGMSIDPSICPKLGCVAITDSYESGGEEYLPLLGRELQV